MDPEPARMEKSMLCLEVMSCTERQRPDGSWYLGPEKSYILISGPQYYTKSHAIVYLGLIVSLNASNTSG